LVGVACFIKLLTQLFNTYSSLGDRLLGDDGQKHADDHHKVAAKCCAGKQQGGVFENLHGVVLHVDSGAEEGLQKCKKNVFANTLLRGATFALNMLTAWINLRITILAVLGILLVWCSVVSKSTATHKRFFVNTKSRQNVNILHTRHHR
jgi:hypothetical protein